MKRSTYLKEVLACDEQFWKWKFDHEIEGAHEVGSVDGVIKLTWSM